MKTVDNGMTPGGGGGGGWKPSGSMTRNRGESRGPYAGTATGAPPPVSPGGRVPSVPRERKPAMAALGLLLVVVGVLASVYLQQSTQHRVGVVEISRTVAAGQSITGSDITEAMVAIDPSITYVTWAQRADLFAHYSAATTLVPGTLLVANMITSASPIPSSDEVAGVNLKDGNYPDGIQAGDEVSGYYVSNKNSDPNGTQYMGDGFTSPPMFSKVEVYSVGQLGTSGSIDVSLVLPQSLVAAAVQAASGGNLVLVFDKHTPSS
jgi:hypothetical protein